MWLLFAASSAVCFGFRGILYQWTSRQPIDRNLLLLGVYLSGTIIALVSNVPMKQPWSSGALIGILMGLFSFSANAAMYKGFAVGKASLIAVLTALPPVVVVILAYTLWHERLNGLQTASFAVIVAGMLLIRYSNDISLSNLQGAGWGLLAMITFALTDLMSKQATLLGASTLPALIMMYATGSLLFLAAWLLGLRKAIGRTGQEPALSAETAEAELAAPARAVAEQSSAGNNGMRWTKPRTLLWGMVVGLTNITGMMFALPAFRLGVTGLVSAVLALNVLLILLYARVMLKEKFSRLEKGGLALAFIGILILRLAG
jgi:drug/metabolite transporter (DMT)-like permease